MHELRSRISRMLIRNEKNKTAWRADLTGLVIAKNAKVHLMTCGKPV